MDNQTKKDKYAVRADQWRKAFGLVLTLYEGTRLVAAHYMSLAKGGKAVLPSDAELKRSEDRIVEILEALIKIVRE